MSLIRATRRGFPQGYIDGFVLSYVSATQMSCTAGECRSSDDSTDIVLLSSLTFDITVSGAGGRRPGMTEAANTWYSLWIIADSTGALPVSGQIGDPATSLVSGYDEYRRIGWVRNDGSSNFRSYNMVRAAGQAREIHCRNTAATSQFLTAGAAAAMTTVDLTPYVPPTGVMTLIKAAFLGAAATDAVRWRSSVDSGVSSPPQVSYSGDTATGSSMNSETFYLYTPVQTLDYQVVATGTVNAYVIGWIDDLTV